MVSCVPGRTPTSARRVRARQRSRNLAHRQRNPTERAANSPGRRVSDLKTKRMARDQSAHREQLMTTIEQASAFVGTTAGIFDRDRIIAKAGFNRWLVPPAALCIHLCIGMAY